MKNQVLSVNQMQHLKKLGIDRRQASMCRVTDKNGKTRLVVHSLQCYDNKKYVRVIPAFTAQDILDLLPIKITKDDGSKFYLNVIFPNDDAWEITYSRLGSILESFFHKNLLTVAYKTLCWCAENGYINTNKRTKQ